MSFSHAIEEEAKSFCNACGNQFENSRGHICATRMGAPKGLFNNAADPFSPYVCTKCQGIYVPAYTKEHNCKSIEEQVAHEKRVAIFRQDSINQQRAEEEARRKSKVEEFKNAAKPSVESLEKLIAKCEQIHEHKLENWQTVSYPESAKKKHFEHIAKLQSELDKLKAANKK